MLCFCESSRWKSLIRVTLVVMAVANILVLSPWTVSAAIGKSKVIYKDGWLTVEADNISMVSLLSDIAKKTNVVIFVSKGFDPGKVSIHLDKHPLEDAFGKILKGYNHVAIYSKKNNEFVVSALKIFPRGKAQGPMDMIITKSISTEQTKGFDIEDTARIPGETLPGEYVRYALKRDRSLVGVAHGFEKKEKQITREINELKLKAGEALSQSQKELFNLELMNKLADFELVQRGHTDAMEALYRASKFKEQSKTAD